VFLFLNCGRHVSAQVKIKDNELSKNVKADLGKDLA
jgi:hypothetical protein